jgi:hypothetical protein
VNILALAALALPAQETWIEDFEQGLFLRWRKIESPEHPFYNRAEIAEEAGAAPSGIRYLRLVTQGGKVGVEIHPAVAVPVDAQAAYRLRLWIRLQGARRNSAWGALAWRDSRGRPLAPPVRTPALAGQDVWTEVQADLPEPPPEAASATILLAFEGPDVRGEAHFDLVRLERRVFYDVRPVDRPHPVYEPAERPRLRIRARGLPPGEHALRPTLAGGTERRALPEVLLRPDATPVPLELPPLPPGAYRLELAPNVDTPLVVLPPPWPEASPLENPFHLRLDAASLPPEPGALLRAAGVRHVRFPLSADPVTLEKVRDLVRAGGFAILGVGSSCPPLLREFIARWEPDAPALPLPADPVDLLRALLDAPSGTDLSPAPGVLEPGPSLLALRAAGRILAGASPRADLQSLLEPPLRRVLERKGTLIAVAWSDAPEDVRFPWAEGAGLYDPRSGIRPVSAESSFRLDRMPVFLGPVNAARLADHLAVRLDDPVLPLRRGPVTRRLRLPSGAVEPRIRILAPAGWTVRTAPEGELQFLLPDSEEEGVRSVDISVSFVRDGARREVRKTLPVRIAAPLEVSVRTRPSGTGRVAEVLLVNRSGREVSLTAILRPSGGAEARHLVPRLAPEAAARPLECPIVDPSRPLEVRLEEIGGERLFLRRSFRVDR